MPRGIIDARKELQRAEVELTALQRQARGVAGKIDELEAVVRALRYFLRREGAAADDTANGWAQLSRAKAVERVLRAASEPMAPSAIAEELRDRGRKGDTPNGVSGALWKLRQAGKAEPMPGGQGWLWISKDDEDFLPNGQAEEARVGE